MKLLLALFVLSFSPFIQGMGRTPSGELRQRADKTVSGQNRLTRSTSGKLEKVGRAIKKSTSSDSLLNLSRMSKKASSETNIKGASQSPTSAKTKKLHFEQVFIDKELFKLTNNFRDEAETALMDGDVKKFEKAYKRMDSPRAQQAILAKADQYRGLDPDFCHVIILLSSKKETDQK